MSDAHGSPGRLVLVRHGATAWSRSGRHTGRTDVPLLPEGEDAARSLAPVLASVRFGLVLASPLLRARQTAALAGLTPEVDADLAEWDYGAFEGLTSAQIRHDRPGWTVFDGEVRGGETLAELAERARRVLSRVGPILAGEDVALVGHGHALRVLACVYLGLDPRHGAALFLDPGSVSVLRRDHDVPAVALWNWRPGMPLADESR